MPQPVTVWAVQLRPELSRERRGTLTLDTEAISFTPADGSAPVRIELREVRKARRLRGSPVMVVWHDAEGESRRTAFYFTQPPPLEPVRGEAQAERPSPLSFGRSQKRKARRQNVGYLSMWNREYKAIVTEWERAVADGRRAAR